MATMKDVERAKEQAKAQLGGIREVIATLKYAEEHGKAKYEGETISRDDLLDRIHQDPLEVSVRSDWHAPGEKGEVTEWKILLCTGGPAVRLIGDLDEHNQADSIRLEYQDWFTEWDSYPLNSEEEADCLEYANQFYFGE